MNDIKSSRNSFGNGVNGTTATGHTYSPLHRHPNSVASNGNSNGSGTNKGSPVSLKNANHIASSIRSVVGPGGHGSPHRNPPPESAPYLYDTSGGFAHRGGPLFHGNTENEQLRRSETEKNSGMSSTSMNCGAVDGEINTASDFAARKSTAATVASLSPELASKLAHRGHVYDYRGGKLEIRDVWRDNLEQEMNVIRELITQYRIVAIDTEFPGVVARPVGLSNSALDVQYQTLRCNVDLLKLIQLGITIADENGNFAPNCPCWQFHFQFSLSDDIYAQDSIDLLVRSGINFELHDKMGINIMDFGEVLVSSGLVLIDNVTWISFHGGYDFGYLLRLLECSPLPDGEEGFYDLFHTYFRRSYDVKHLMTMLGGKTFKAGLNRLAEQLGLSRIGPMHQAGSDSLLTAAVFFALRNGEFNGSIPDRGHAGVLHGIGQGDPDRLFRRSSP